MTIVFLSGSRTISRLNDEVRQRLTNMMDSNLDIVTGDANGADKAMQAYLASLQYPRVTIYYVGDAPRNNVGCWVTRKVADTGKLTGRDYYAQKDKEMSGIADYGFVLWDGKSSGSVQNMLWLMSEGKKAVVYVSPQKRFHTFKSEDEVVGLLLRCDDEILDDIARKIELPDALKRANRKQAYLNLQ